jgi:hypothetical protein
MSRLEVCCSQKTLSATPSLARIFAAVPRAPASFLRQLHRAVAPCIVCELDFGWRDTKSYQPSMVID